MSIIISASIDLLKLDRSKIIKGKNGAEYYPLNIIVNDVKDQYNNDVSVTDSQSKEQRQAKEKKVYLGNGRVIWSGQSKQPQQSETPKDIF